MIKGNTMNTIMISPNFLVLKFCRKTQLPPSFGESPETMRKPCLSTKCPPQTLGETTILFVVFTDIKLALSIIKCSHNMNQIKDNVNLQDWCNVDWLLSLFFLPLQQVWIQSCPGQITTYESEYKNHTKVVII